MFGSANEFLHTDPRCKGPSCLIMDMKMPELSGFDLQEELNKKAYTLPMGVKAMKTGAVDFLTKPFDEADLLNAVQVALKKDAKNRVTMHERQTILLKFEFLIPPGRVKL